MTAPAPLRDTLGAALANLLEVAGPDVTPGDLDARITGLPPAARSGRSSSMRSARAKRSRTTSPAPAPSATTC
jgi:hypothetical protein